MVCGGSQRSANPGTAEAAFFKDSKKQGFFAVHFLCLQRCILGATTREAGLTSQGPAPQYWSGANGAEPQGQTESRLSDEHALARQAKGQARKPSHESGSRLVRAPSCRHSPALPGQTQQPTTHPGKEAGHRPELQRSHWAHGQRPQVSLVRGIRACHRALGALAEASPLLICTG